MSRVSRRRVASMLAALVAVVATNAGAQAPRTPGPPRGVLWTPEYTDSLSLQLDVDVRARLTQARSVALARDRDLQNTRVADHGPPATFDEIPEVCELLRADFYVRVTAQPSSDGIAAVAVVGPCRNIPADTLREPGASIPVVGHTLTERILRKALAFSP